MRVAASGHPGQAGAAAGPPPAHWLGRPPLMRAAAMAPGRPSEPSRWLPPENCSGAGTARTAQSSVASDSVGKPGNPGQAAVQAAGQARKLAANMAVLSWSREETAPAEATLLATPLQRRRGSAAEGGQSPTPRPPAQRPRFRRSSQSVRGGCLGSRAP